MLVFLLIVLYSHIYRQLAEINCQKELNESIIWACTIPGQNYFFVLLNLYLLSSPNQTLDSNVPLTSSQVADCSALILFRYKKIQLVIWPFLSNRVGVT